MAGTTITKQVLQNGFRNYVALFTIASDGTTATAAGALDPTSAGDMGVNYAGQVLFPDTHFKLWELKYNLAPGMQARLVWKATSDQAAYNMLGFGKQLFMRQGGIGPYSAGVLIAGATGKLDLILPAFTLQDGQAAAYGSIEVWAKKDISG